MKELELRFYTLKEIIEATECKHHSNSKRDVEKKLKDENYEYKWYDRKGVRILRHKEIDEPERLLKRLLVERLGLNTQIDAVDFACFVSAYQVIEGFAAMPWETRLQKLNEYFGLTESESTFYNWARKLFESENAKQLKKVALWHTTKDKNGKKKQECVEPTSEEYRAFCTARSECLIRLEKEGVPPEKRFGTMIHLLSDEWGHYFYCPETCLDAFGPDIEEISRLVKEIMEKR